MVLGPYATQILADYGADVIKVGPPQGDLMRKSGATKNADMGALYLQLNRNKRSVVLDLKQPAARAALLRLCERADVLIHNTRLAAMRRLQLGDDNVRKINPRLVYVSLVGYGDNDPMRASPPTTISFRASAPPATAVQAGGQDPRYVPLTLTDRIVGINAAHVVLAALIHRDRTGEGQAVELPMFETMAQFVLGDHLGGRSFQPPIGGPGYARMLTPNRRPYGPKTATFARSSTPTNTGRVFLRHSAASMNFAPTRASPITPPARAVQRSVRHGRGILATKTTAEWMALFERCDIPCAPMNEFDALIDDPHLRGGRILQTQAHPTEGRARCAGIPSRWNGAALQITRHAPCLGERSLPILNEAGLPAADIEALLKNGATINGQPACGAAYA